MLSKNHLECSFNAKKYNPFFINLVETDLTPNITIMVLKNNEIIYEFSYGNAKPKGHGISTSLNMLYNIGSVSKVFTAVLFVKLVEMGVVSVRDYVCRHIPEFRFPDITIQHLLTHRAGFASEIYDKLKWPQQKSEVNDFMKKIYLILRQTFITINVFNM